MTKNRIGIDVGGTNIKFALVSPKGEILYSNSTPTRSEMGYEYTVNNMKQAIITLMEETNSSKSNVEGIGFGFPGQIDYKNGIVKHSTNIPGWNNVSITDIIEKEFGIPTRIDNDVRVATLGELNYGAGKGCNNLVCITVGTGIGSGIVINGKLVRGASNTAGEIGHIKLFANGDKLCGCGDYGCLEAYVSGPSIVTMAEEYLKGGKSTKFREMAENGVITPYIVAKAAEQGDGVANMIFKFMGEYLGTGLASVVNLLNPERIIIGGGVAACGDLLLKPTKEALMKRAMPVSAEAVEIVPAQLGNNAGVIGASLLIES